MAIEPTPEEIMLNYIDNCLESLWQEFDEERWSITSDLLMELEDLTEFRRGVLLGEINAFEEICMSIRKKQKNVNLVIKS